MLDAETLARITAEEPDDRRFIEMTSEQRLALFLELCELADSVVRGRPDADRLRAPTPLSADSAALWKRLMERG